MVFDGRFKDHILPDRIHLLNVSFLVPGMRRNFGGCAGNIAYNLKLLGGEGHAMAVVGSDFGPYEAWMRANGLSLAYIDRMESEYTPQAYITTDLDSNQITAFHPGSMMFAHRQRVPPDAGIRIGVVAPENREGMIEHSRQFVAAGIPVLFDPGQGLPLFTGDDLRRFIDEATWVAVNDYEANLLADRTGRRSRRSPRSRCAGRHARRQGLEHIRRRQGARDSGRAHRRNLGSDRLRRCVPRRAHPRAAAAARLADDRPDRLADGRDQDRAPRHAEPSIQPRRLRGALPRQFRPGNLT